MTAQTAVPSVESEASAAPASGPGTIRVAAIALWGVVGTLLGYGVLQTVLKASALFTG